ncbi:unnamed protein product, partial [Timema podura]|nr:unnamed protein product [Timema podura]
MHEISSCDLGGRPIRTSFKVDAVSFLKGDTQIMADEAFQNAVQSYYEVFLRSERVMKIVQSGACSQHDFREVFRNNIEKRVRYDRIAVVYRSASRTKMAQEQKCFIYDTTISDSATVEVKEKGRKTFRRLSLKRSDGNIDFLLKKISVRVDDSYRKRSLPEIDGLSKETVLTSWMAKFDCIFKGM